jgi:hypothetical protein
VRWGHGTVTALLGPGLLQPSSVHRTASVGGLILSDQVQGGVIARWAGTRSSYSRSRDSAGPYGFTTGKGAAFAMKSDGPAASAAVSTCAAVWCGPRAHCPRVPVARRPGFALPVRCELTRFRRTPAARAALVGCWHPAESTYRKYRVPRPARRQRRKPACSKQALWWGKQVQLQPEARELEPFHLGPFPSQPRPAELSGELRCKIAPSRAPAPAKIAPSLAALT